ncbi:protein windpipe isoform X2 [Drosophila serrata]|nr:protein windpipe isoform X2 [Drosophila serrata]XP_020800416.1 protein windpipe isoform X2 [Drosophila serrata]XP_020800427.1 protein windpipe isoform X2 [Drosophila serrata]XP_020800435.1 protein windpipe isoform X2 [Drosophila serrata]XP_020800443.1 protein windpipe isoform X2 [Drosophila serrata]XP_020800447.1 protein windpipe isoform X2 [Drosophila serrata]
MKHSLLAAGLALLLCVSVAATPTPSLGLDCPADCSCTLAQHTHKPLYHLKCNSTAGLRLAEKPFQTSVPVHSLDLSHLGLTRLGHVLDKLPELTSVDLSHNELSELGHLSKGLKRLSLKHNQLTSEKLKKLPQHLQVLNLQHNQITQLPLELTHMHQLRQLELSHNAINCSCQTLEVRNWLVERIVYMEHPVVCSYPLEYKGRSWLQLKQEEICQKEKQHWSDPDVEENELMMGDQPAAASGEHENEDELDKDFLPLSGKAKSVTSKKARSPQEPLPGDLVEGSGDLSETNMELSMPVEPEAAESEVSEAVVTTSKPESVQSNVEDEEDDAEASGSGGGLLIIPDPSKVRIASEEDLAEDKEPESPTPQENDGKPLENPGNGIFTSHMGIFEGQEKDDKPVEEEPIVPFVQTKLETDVKSEVVTDGPLDSSEESQDVQTASVSKRTDDSSAIYYLLAVIGLIVVGLILFVAIKRCKYDSNAAARDAEAQRQTELLDMDKKQLGKPLQKNGHGNGQEHSPLIGEKTKLDEAQIVKKPYENGDAKDGANQQPLLNGNGSANGGAKEASAPGEPAPHEYYPISPRYPTPQSPRASKYAQHQQPDAEQNNNNEPDAAYLPSSPKSGRYSPVYSPETGRVKIKLTETPKPKTPMLVTRSKSNAGDIITTPVPTHLSVPLNAS